MLGFEPIHGRVDRGGELGVVDSFAFGGVDEDDDIAAAVAPVRSLFDLGGSGGGTAWIIPAFGIQA